jgi:hypothetical protein
MHLLAESDHVFKSRMDGTRIAVLEAYRHPRRTSPPWFPLACHCEPPSEVEDLLNIVNQAVKHPLYVDFDSSSQGESI